MSITRRSTRPRLSTRSAAWCYLPSLKRLPSPGETSVFPSETGRTPVIAENIWRRNFLPRLKTVGPAWATICGDAENARSLMRDLDVAPKLVADQLGHTLDVSLNVSAKSRLARRGEALALFESRLEDAQISGAPN